MKVCRLFPFLAALSAAVIGIGLLSRQAHAAYEYFDLNGTTAGSGVANGGSYTWEGSNWNTNNLSGTSSTHSWVEGDIAVFSAGTDANGDAYTITANSNHTVTGIQVNNNGGGMVTVNGPGVLTISNLNPQPFYVGGPAATTSLKINAVLTGTGVQWAPSSGGGGLYLYGVNTFGAGSSTDISTSQPLYFNNSKSFGNSNVYFHTVGTISNPDTTGPLTLSNLFSLGSFSQVTYSGHDPVTFNGTFNVGGTLLIGDGQFPNSTLTLSGHITGSGGLKVDTAYNGTLVLGIPNLPSDYTGTTTIGGDAGGLAVLQGLEAQGLSYGSPIALNGGLLQGTGLASTFSRSISSGGHGIYWTQNGGGFSAMTANIGGSASEVVWGTTVGSQIVGTLKLMGATFVNGVDLNGGARTVSVLGTNGSAGTMSGVIRDSGTGGGLTKTGPATLILTGANTYAGTTTISEGAIRATEGIGFPTGSFLSLDGGVLERPSAGSFIRSLGTSGNTFQWAAGGGGFSAAGGQLTVNIGGAGAELVWGTAVGSQIVGPLKFGSLNSNAKTLFVNGIDMNDSATPATRTINVTHSITTGDSTEIAGVLRNSGAAAGLTKTGTGNLLLTGANTYTGATTVSGGVLFAASLADGGLVSSIGQSTNDAANLVLSGGTLRYTGGGESTDRLFTLGTGATAGGIDASGSGAPLVFTNSGSMAMSGAGTRTLTLTGTNNGDNTMSLAIGNDGANATSLTKAGTGRWVLPGANTYSGTTTLSAGTLAIGSDNSLGTSQLTFANGGIAASGGARLIANNIVLAGTGTVGGADDFTFNGSLTTSTTSRTLTVNNSGITTLAGPINISDSATSRFLTISGSGNTVVTGIIANGGTSTASGLTKGGTGTVGLSGNNTYAGRMFIASGTLVVSSLNKVVGGSPSSNLGAPTTVANGTIWLGSSNPTSTGTLRYIGPGETTDRVIDLPSTTGNGAIDASGTGPLSFSSAFTATGAGSKSLTLLGTSTDDNTIGGAIVDNSAANKTSLVKSGEGKWVLAGANTYSGGTTISGGLLAVSGSAASLGTGNLTVQGPSAGSALAIQSGVANAISDIATLNLLGGGTAGVADQGYIDLGAGLNERIGLLQLGGVAQARGVTYGSAASGAMIQSDEYFAGTGVISVGIFGDFNGDNSVNTADFAIWRKNPSAFGGSAGYDLWVANFGNTTGSGSGVSSDGTGVPEPSSILLLTMGIAARVRRRRAR
jgi:fibronectin-binding autotransporter adhesin